MLLSTDLQRGGFPLRLVRMARALPAFGVTPIVGCLAPRGPLNDELEAMGIESFACDARGAADVLCLARLARLVRRINPDLVHSGLFHANLAVRLVGRLDRARPIITSTATIEIERHWHRWLESMTAGLSHWHLANSGSVAAHVVDDLGFDSARVVMIPNGLDLNAIDRAGRADRAELGIPSDQPLVAWAGRMDPIKDLTTFVETIARLRRIRPVQAILIGDGPERFLIEARVARLGLSGVIHFAGWRRDVVEWLKSADALLFPSRTEGCPNVVLEAMAAGCPVVASAIAPCRDLIVPGATGLLCPPGDSTGFAEALDHLLVNDEWRQQMSVNASSRAHEHFNIQCVVERLAHLYRIALGHRIDAR